MRVDASLVLSNAVLELPRALLDALVLGGHLHLERLLQHGRPVGVGRRSLVDLLLLDLCRGDRVLQLLELLLRS